MPTQDKLMSTIPEMPAVVYAVIVSYRPDVALLAKLLEALTLQVSGIIIVDNGSSAETLTWLTTRHLSVPYQLVQLGDNFGIARAQNDGIQVASDFGANHVILFDQDSVPAFNMVSLLLLAAQHKAAEGFKVASVGPNYWDERQENPPPFITVSGLRLKRQTCSTADAVVPVDYLIASGCLIPLATFNQVGRMREDFFIDYVDIEWGLRAKVLGFQSFGVCAAFMAHDLGNEPIKFFGQRYPQHSPLRHYYHFRNAVSLYRQGWVPMNWRIVDGWRLILKLGFYALFAKPRMQHLGMMLKGIMHGLYGRMGRLH